MSIQSVSTDPLSELKSKIPARESRERSSASGGHTERYQRNSNPKIVRC